MMPPTEAMRTTVDLARYLEEQGCRTRWVEGNLELLFVSQVHTADATINKPTYFVV